MLIVMTLATSVVGLIVISCLLKEIEKIFAGNVFKYEEEESVRLKCAMKCDDVWMRGKGLHHLRP